MSKHTPGPWVSDSYGLVSGSANGLTIICETHANRWALCQASANSEHNEAADFCGAMHKEAIANARLISAAPELLEALEMLLGRVISDQEALNSDYGPSGREIIKQARAAIAKAKGAA